MEVEADGGLQHRQVLGVAGLKEAVDSLAGILRE